MDPKEALEKGYVKICPCERLTTMMLPDFEWKDGYIVREIGKSCPTCKIEHRENHKN